MGVGGGIIVVPILVLAFGFDIKVAVVSSLFAVVASSTAAGSVYVGKGLANMRLGMWLEVATTLGGIAGGLVAVFVSSHLITMIFSFLMMIIAFLVFRAKDKTKTVKFDGTEDSKTVMIESQEDAHSLSGSYYDVSSRSTIHYQVERSFLGSIISFFAGMLSGLLGVGGGFIKVPAMHLGMNVPIKVATATSNFMIGVTAISSLFVYFMKGMVYPLVAAPVAIGVVGGALYGTTLAQKISAALMKKVFAILLVLVAVQMLLSAMGVKFGQ
ncbi:hypothetical protein A11Q_1739 [Pseudobdellovibrio exovorus JSS]|uniref:Probable membrane transporter protein n=2 Tax=Pseudobdellovibrio exovorus TaxID=453816 RepID=M4VBT9_9BACT|nr:hypothetical protein A11Q_1739 [Pseudobdellovibrio exovorus JSS]